MEETAEMFNSFKERMKQRQVIQSNKSKPEDTRAKNNKGTTGGDGKHQGTWLKLITKVGTSVAVVQELEQVIY